MAEEQIEVLSQIISEDEGEYRIRAGDRVHYLTIDTRVFDRDTLCRPYLLIPKLPNFPDSAWTKMHITRSSEGDGALVLNTTHEPMEEISFIWHEQRIDVLSLPFIKRLKSGVFETIYKDEPAIAKIACFEWQIPNITRETWAYHVLDHDNDGEPIAPAFLGHLTENGRVMGFLMRRVEGRAACLGDLARCEALVLRLHRLGGLGLVHGDVNRYNFIVEDTPDGRIWLVDFEHAQDYDEEAGRAEFLSLASELAEETGRGTVTTIQS